MGQSSQIVARGMEVSVYKSSWVDPYLYCCCTTSDDPLLLNVLLWKLDREFSKGVVKK